MDITEENRRFDRSAEIYAFTTENLSGYMSNLELSGKKVLTVCGSGDQMLNAFMLGAEEVVNFDVNQNSSHIAELKMEAVKRLPYDDFLRFFMRGREAFNKDTFGLINDSLRAESRIFFEEGMAVAGHDGYNYRESMVFNNRFDEPSLKRSYNPYLKDDGAYLRARDGIKDKKMRFIHSSLGDLNGSIGDERFDIILLSNIGDYVKDIFPDEQRPLEKFFETMVMPLKKRLNKCGKIIGAYIYGTDGADDDDDDDDNAGRDVMYHSEIDNPGKRKETLDKNDIEWKEVSFKSAKGNGKDSIIIIE